MSNITLLGIDLAKDVFQVCGLNQANKMQFNRGVRRQELVQAVMQHPDAIVAMEACGSAHHWGRVFSSKGFTVIMVPAQFVKGFSRGNKTDAKDALAIAESACRPELRPVQVKGIEQQDHQTLLRYRARQIELKVAASNQARGILSEYGLVMVRGAAAFKRRVPEILEDGDNGLTPITRSIISNLYDEYNELVKRIAELDQQIKQIVHQHALMSQLIKLRGVGPISAMAIYAAVGQGHHFKNARHLSAWIGLVPKQFGTGGKVWLGSISKRGDQYLRTLLIHGARTVMNWMKEKTDGFSLWAKQLLDRRGKHKAIVAVANKTARMIWVVLNRGIENVPRDYLSA